MVMSPSRDRIVRTPLLIQLHNGHTRDQERILKELDHTPAAAFCGLLRVSGADDQHVFGHREYSNNLRMSFLLAQQ